MQSQIELPPDERHICMSVISKTRFLRFHTDLDRPRVLFYVSVLLIDNQTTQVDLFRVSLVDKLIHLSL